VTDIDTVIDSLGWIVETWKEHGKPEPTTTQEGNFTLSHACHALAAARRMKEREATGPAIDEIRERWAKATPGPWSLEVDGAYHVLRGPKNNGDDSECVAEAYYAAPADAEAIVGAPFDVETLLSALDAATARAERAEAALEDANERIEEVENDKLSALATMDSALDSYATSQREIESLRTALQASEKRRGELEAENARLVEVRSTHMALLGGSRSDHDMVEERLVALEAAARKVVESREPERPPAVVSDVLDDAIDTLRSVLSERDGDA
jgi:DNA repair exonuclease SbcCD ATPase subunit